MAPASDNRNADNAASDRPTAFQALRRWVLGGRQPDQRFHALASGDDDGDVESVHPEPPNGAPKGTATAATTPVATSPAGEKVEDYSLAAFFRIYARAFNLLGEEVSLGYKLAVANIFLSVALLAEPLLFGRVINALTLLGSDSSASTTARLWQQLLPLLLVWSAFSAFGACASIFIGLYADQLSHRRRHVVYAEGACPRPPLLVRRSPSPHRTTHATHPTQQCTNQR
jgi:hypothetical protein